MTNFLYSMRRSCIDGAESIRLACTFICSMSLLHRYVSFPLPKEYRRAIVSSSVFPAKNSSRVGTVQYPSNSPKHASTNTCGASLRSFTTIVSHFPLSNAQCVTAHPPANRSTRV